MAKDHAQIDDSGVVQRKLNDGRTIDIMKAFYCPDELERQLDTLGWTGAVQTTGKLFYYGCAAQKGAGQPDTPVDADKLRC